MREYIMQPTSRTFLIAVAFLACQSLTFATNRENLLHLYIENPKEAVAEEVLALVEIVSIVTDTEPEKPWKQTGTLHLRLIEAVGGEVPKGFTVRFFTQIPERVNTWQWDCVTLTVGKRLLGFFNKWGGENWSVRNDSRSNVISNPEKIAEDLNKRVQPLFKTVLRPTPGHEMQNKVLNDSLRNAD